MPPATPSRVASQPAPRAVQHRDPRRCLCLRRHHHHHHHAAADSYYSTIDTHVRMFQYLDVEEAIIILQHRRRYWLVLGSVCTYGRSWHHTRECVWRCCYLYWCYSIHVVIIYVVIGPLYIYVHGSWHRCYSRLHLLVHVEVYMSLKVVIRILNPFSWVYMSPCLVVMI